MPRPPGSDPDPAPETGRLARWSRRKQAAREGVSDPQDDPLPAAAPEPAPEPAPDPADLEANRAAAEAVDLATLRPDSDLEVFFRDGVPKLLRQQALRAVWRSDPVFANLDGLVDHGENFRDPALVMKTFTSAWKIGSGYLREVAADAAATPAADPPAEAPAAPEPPAAATPLPEAGPDTPPASEPEETAPVTAEADEAAAARPAPEPAPRPAAAPARASLRRRLALDRPDDPGGA